MSNVLSPDDCCLQIAPSSSRPTWAEIDLAALRFNVRQIRARVGETTQIMGIVKANAYGHGLARIAQELVACGVEQLGVAFVEEGIELRRAGIEVPILVLGGIIGDQVEEFLRWDLTITASSPYKLELIEDAAQKLGKRAKIHVKIDTGMERLGVHHYSAETLLEHVACSRWCDLCGVFSHLATSESEDHSFTDLQLERFLRVLRMVSAQRNCNAAATHRQFGRHLKPPGNFSRHGASRLDVVRRLSRGKRPTHGRNQTCSIAENARRVFQSDEARRYHRLQPNLGRRRTIRALSRCLWVYGDGYRRSLSNKGCVLVRGVKAPIVGVVSMDQVTVDIGPSGTAYNDDEVVLLGEQGGQKIAIEDLAGWMDTIPYEVLTGINTRVPRVYVNEL